MTYIQPFFALLLISSVFLFITADNKRKRRIGAQVLALMLLLFSWQPAAWLALGSLEHGYSRELPPTTGVQAIVVLSSRIVPPNPPRLDAIVGEDTYERCWYAAWLHRNRFAVPILASGGGRSEWRYALVMRQALKEMDVPPAMIWTEQTSRSTYENALYSAEILRQKGIHRIALVTEAYHMPRAVRCFRKQGLDVVPAPCGFRGSWQATFKQLLPDWRAVSWNEAVLHEWVGLAWYWIRGWI